MSTNGLNVEDADMAECDGEKVVTMVDVLQEQQEFEEDANAVLGASDEKNCTYNQGYIKRQAIYACLTCCSDAKEDPTKRAGVCLACSLTCHEHHDLVELYTKRNFRCDCGNPKFTNPCQYTENKTELNDGNAYNQNFSGLYCTCHRPYPDPEGIDEEMIQCIVCEDWFHVSHLEATVPSNDLYAEMVCKACMEKNEFLHDYNKYAVNGDVDVVSIENEEISAHNGDVKANGIVDKEIDEKEKGDTNDEKVAVAEETTEPDSTEASESTANDTDKVEVPPTPNNSLVQDASDEKPADAESKVEASTTDSITAENTAVAAETTAVSSEVAPVSEAVAVPGETSTVASEAEAVASEIAAEGTEDTKEDKTEETSASKTEDSVNAASESANSEEERKNDEKASTENDKTKISSEVPPENVPEKTAEEQMNVDETKPSESLPEDSQIKDVEMNESSTVEESKTTTEPDQKPTEHKRKLSIEEAEDEISVKKPKLEEGKCLRPRNERKKFKGATFWPSHFRQKLCTCNTCVTMYKDLSVLYLIDLEDTVTAYEALGKERTNGTASTQYEKGLEALSSLGRVQQINALTEYNKMKDKLLDFLKSFKDKKEVVKEEDIKAFFAGMKPKREPDGVYFCR